MNLNIVFIYRNQVLNMKVYMQRILKDYIFLYFVIISHLLIHCISKGLSLILWCQVKYVFEGKSILVDSKMRRSCVLPTMQRSLTTHIMTTCIKYPIGSNALWEVHGIFS